jgi:hypothetical protein
VHSPRVRGHERTRAAEQNARAARAKKRARPICGLEGLLVRRLAAWRALAFPLVWEILFLCSVRVIQLWHVSLVSAASESCCSAQHCPSGQRHLCSPPRLRSNERQEREAGEGDEQARSRQRALAARAAN